MIRITQCEGEMHVGIDTKHKGDDGELIGLRFDHNLGEDREIFAKITIAHLRDHMRQQLAEIRREAYEEGWKNAKAKTPKKGLFSGAWAHK